MNRALTRSDIDDAPSVGAPGIDLCGAWQSAMQEESDVDCSVGGLEVYIWSSLVVLGQLDDVLAIDCGVGLCPDT